MIVDKRTNGLWLSIVDQIQINLRWSRDEEHPESGAIVASLGDEISARVWPEGTSRDKMFKSEVSWPRGHKTFISRSENTIAAAKLSAALAAKMLAAEMLYDVSTSSRDSIYLDQSM